MNERTALLASIAETIKDYRAGELPPPTPEHVDRWIQQFDREVQLQMLREMDYVLKQTYFSLAKVTNFLRDLVRTEKLVGQDPCAFWRTVNFLDIQQGGNSQTEMLELFDKVLQEQCGFRVAECGVESAVYLYLDDGLFTGNRIRRDLEAWIATDSPAAASLHVVTIALHSGGQHYANGRIRNALTAARKGCAITWWRAIELEDRKAYSDTADVLRPTSIPDDAAVQNYVRGMKHPPTIRRPGNVGGKSLFSSDAGKQLLEQEFLKAGARIRGLCQNLGDTQRPLGHMTLETLGFGSLIVTFRNCPNNAPLALWVGDPWYPLLPRTTNSQTAIKRLFEELTRDAGDEH